jgi:Flp pilus assembly protein TadD
MNQLALNGLVVIEGRATYERIISSIRGMEPDEAIRQIQNFLKIYPEFAQAHNDIAVLYYQSGNGLKALAHYEKANKLEPSNITFRKNLADFYFVELEWSDDAIQTYLDILKDNPFDIDTLNALGTISNQIGRREQARQYFTRTLQLDAVNSQARLALHQLGGGPVLTPQPAQLIAPTQHTGGSAVTNTQPPVYVASKQATVFHEPQKKPEQLHRQALELVNSGKSSEAHQAFMELLILHPDYAVGHNDFGIFCQQSGDLVQSRTHLEEAHRLQPENVIFQKNLADLLSIACGETEEALKMYVTILRHNPRDVETLMAISNICLALGKTVDARSFLENILKIEPWNNEIREALASISPADEASDFSDRTVDQMYADAQEYIQKEMVSEAHSLLEELVHIDGDNALFQNDLGVLRYRLGNFTGARISYERAADLLPANSNFRKNLADLYFAEFGMVDEAIRIYLDLFRLQPGDLEVLAALGQICMAVGQPDEAKSFYRRALEIDPWNADIRDVLKQIE